MTTFKNPDYQMGIENTEAEQYAWFWDGARCTGCKACQIACQDYKQLPANMFFRQIYDYTGGSFTVNNDGTYTQNVYSYPISMACNHCGNPACLENCPAGAIFKDSHGFVAIDEEKCIGCGTCTQACPYHVPVLNEETKKSNKCNGCEERVLAGKSPICVEACSMRALAFGPYDEIVDKYGDRLVDIAPMPDPKITAPACVIKPAPTAVKWDDTEGHVENLTEVPVEKQDCDCEFREDI